jgi:very-short-patch-repair endonuclease
MRLDLGSIVFGTARGSQHARRVSADVRRDEVLRRAGYRELRLEAQAVLRAPREAALAVLRALGHG